MLQIALGYRLTGDDFEVYLEFTKCCETPLIFQKFLDPKRQVDVVLFLEKVQKDNCNRDDLQERIFNGKKIKDLLGYYYQPLAAYSPESGSASFFSSGLRAPQHFVLVIVIRLLFIRLPF